MTLKPFSVIYFVLAQTTIGYETEMFIGPSQDPNETIFLRP